MILRQMFVCTSTCVSSEASNIKRLKTFVITLVTPWVSGWLGEHACTPASAFGRCSGHLSLRRGLHVSIQTRIARACVLVCDPKASDSVLAGLSMADEAQPDVPAKPAIIIEKAVSGRSTCRSTGEKIEKGELRVGMEAYLGGRISMTWQARDRAPSAWRPPSSCCAVLPLHSRRPDCTPATA